MAKPLFIRQVTSKLPKSYYFFVLATSDLSIKTGYKLMIQLSPISKWNENVHNCYSLPNSASQALSLCRFIHLFSFLISLIYVLPLFCLLVIVVSFRFGF